MSKFIKLALVTAFIAGGAITQVQAETAPVEGLRGGTPLIVADGARTQDRAAQAPFGGITGNNAANSAPAVSTLSANTSDGLAAELGPDWAGR